MTQNHVFWTLFWEVSTCVQERSAGLAVGFVAVLVLGHLAGVQKWSFWTPVFRVLLGSHQEVPRALG